MELFCVATRCLVRGTLVAALMSLFFIRLAAAQVQVGSPENPRDCKGIDYGGNRRDSAGVCCMPAEMSCGKCSYKMSPCEIKLGCGTLPDYGCGCGGSKSCYGCDGVPYAARSTRVAAVARHR